MPKSSKVYQVREFVGSVDPAGAERNFPPVSSGSQASLFHHFWGFGNRTEADVIRLDRVPWSAVRAYFDSQGSWRRTRIYDSFNDFHVRVVGPAGDRFFQVLDYLPAPESFPGWPERDFTRDVVLASEARRD